MNLPPEGLTVIEWTDRAAESLSRLGAIPKLTHPEDWRRWASSVTLTLERSGQTPPNHATYSTWDAWVHDLNRSVDIQL